MPPHAAQKIARQHSRTQPAGLPMSSPKSLSAGVGARRQIPPPPPPPEIEYVVYLRLPFPRNGFVDPPQVDWDASKERLLWRILSRTARNSDIDWSELAQQFQVTRAFLLQQAAWLYERELSQVRAQMRRGAGPLTLTASMTQGASSPRPLSPAPMSGVKMMRTVSNDQRIHSAQSTRSQQTSTPRPGNAFPPTPTRPMAQPMSRTPSSATQRPSSQLTIHPHRFSNPISIADYKLGGFVTPETRSRPGHHSPTSSDTYSQSSNSDDGEDDDASDNAPDLSDKKDKVGLTSDNEDDDEFNLAFLPFSAPLNDSSSMDEAEVGTGTLTLSGKRPSSNKGKDKEGVPPAVTQHHHNHHHNRHHTHPHSSSSAANNQSHMRRVLPPNSPVLNPTANRRKSGPTHVQHTHGAESSPSMGSSFSDLSDASVSQSALEDAYLSTIQGGGQQGSQGMGSMAGTVGRMTMSTLSQAVKRSRYFGT